MSEEEQGPGGLPEVITTMKYFWRFGCKKWTEFEPGDLKDGFRTEFKANPIFADERYYMDKPKHPIGMLQPDRHVSLNVRKGHVLPVMITWADFKMESMNREMLLTSMYLGCELRESVDKPGLLTKDCKNWIFAKYKVHEEPVSWTTNMLNRRPSDGR